MTEGVSVIIVDDADFKIMSYIVGVKDRPAGLWRCLETSANCVEHSLGLQLSSVG